MRDAILSRALAVYRASRHVVTPYTGFILSDLFLSDEIRERRLLWLAPKSLPISKRRFEKLRAGGVVYCQVDQLEEFASDYLSFARKPFVLITGKWQLPGLQRSTAIQQILTSSMLHRWYSQNQIFRDLPIEQFPYGVSLSAVRVLAEKMSESPNKERRGTLFVPFATVHSHLTEPALRIRENLNQYMCNPLPLDEYFDEMLSHSFVISPPGDRPDTYRHWESLALGATPILTVTDGLDKILAGAAWMVRDYSEVLAGSEQFIPKPEIPNVHLVRTWVERIRRDRSNAISGKV